MKQNKYVKNIVVSLSKYVSMIFLFISVGIIALLYLGPDITMASSIKFRLAVPSIVLAGSGAVLYELWIKNGKEEAFGEKPYQDLLTIYINKSEGLHYPSLQDFLDYEYRRRYQVEYDRITRLLEREEAIEKKLSQSVYPGIATKLSIKKAQRNIVRYTRKRDKIKINMPYDKSEEFDFLRYSVEDLVHKEYSPKDTKKDLALARAKRHPRKITMAVIGFNILTIGGAMGDIWTAVIMTLLAAVSLAMAAITGFKTGYRNIKVVSTGVYKTANSFLDQAYAYCQREGKDLYYTTKPKVNPIELAMRNMTNDLDGSEFLEDLEQIENHDIFTRAEKMVAKDNK